MSNTDQQDDEEEEEEKSNFLDDEDIHSGLETDESSEILGGLRDLIENVDWLVKLANYR